MECSGQALLFSVYQITILLNFTYKIACPLIKIIKYIVLTIGWITLSSIYHAACSMLQFIPINFVQLTFVKFSFSVLFIYNVYILTQTLVIHIIVLGLRAPQSLMVLYLIQITISFNLYNTLVYPFHFVPPTFTISHTNFPEVKI